MHADRCYRTIKRKPSTTPATHFWRRRPAFSEMSLSLSLSSLLRFCQQCRAAWPRCRDTVSRWVPAKRIVSARTTAETLSTAASAAGDGLFAGLLLLLRRLSMVVVAAAKDGDDDCDDDDGADTLGAGVDNGACRSGGEAVVVASSSSCSLPSNREAAPPRTAHFCCASSASRRSAKRCERKARGVVNSWNNGDGSRWKEAGVAAWADATTTRASTSKEKPCGPLMIIFLSNGNCTVVGEEGGRG